MSILQTDFVASQVDRPTRIGASLPSTARVGETFFRVGTTKKLYACFTANTWSEIAGAGGASSIASTTPPTLSTSTGTAGQIAYDGAFIYVCVATDTWLRAPLSDWPQ